MDVNRCIVTVTQCPEPTARLVVFPHAGGSSNNYRSWASSLSPDIELNVVEYPGHGTRMGDALAVDHTVLVDEAAEAIARNDVRTTVLGHSMGALIAFETARALLSAGTPPLHLFVSAAPAPSTSKGSIDRAWTDEELTAELVRYGATPAELMADPELSRMLIRILRCDYRLIDRYVLRSGVLLPMGITAFYGTADSSVSHGDVLRWKGLTSAGFEALPLSGGHFYEATSVPELCATVGNVIDGYVRSGV